MTLAEADLHTVLRKAELAHDSAAQKLKLARMAVLNSLRPGSLLRDEDNRSVALLRADGWVDPDDPNSLWPIRMVRERFLTGQWRVSH